MHMHSDASRKPNARTRRSGVGVLLVAPMAQRRRRALQQRALASAARCCRSCGKPRGACAADRRSAQLVAAQQRLRDSLCSPVKHVPDITIPLLSTTKHHNPHPRQATSAAASSHRAAPRAAPRSPSSPPAATRWATRCAAPSAAAAARRASARACRPPTAAACSRRAARRAARCCAPPRRARAAARSRGGGVLFEGGTVKTVCM